MGSRLGHFKAFATAYCGVLTAIGLFLYFNPVAAFLAIGALFYFCVTVTSSYQFEVVTKVDTSSSAAMMVMAATVGSIAIGPAIAGYLVTPNYELINGLGFISIALSFVLMLVAIRMSRNVPAA